MKYEWSSWSSVCFLLPGTLLLRSFISEINLLPMESNFSRIVGVRINEIWNSSIYFLHWEDVNNHYSRFQTRWRVTSDGADIANHRSRIHGRYLRIPTFFFDGMFFQPFQYCNMSLERLPVDHHSLDFSLYFSSILSRITIFCFTRQKQ